MVQLSVAGRQTVAPLPPVLGDWQALHPCSSVLEGEGQIGLEKK